MFKGLVISLGKKYIISSINDFLYAHKDDISIITSQIEKWCTRLEKILWQLRMLALRCSDGKIESDEVKATVQEIDVLVKGW